MDLISLLCPEQNAVVFEGDPGIDSQTSDSTCQFSQSLVDGTAHFLAGDPRNRTEERNGARPCPRPPAIRT